jgi:hypothetical protein
MPQMLTLASRSTMVSFALSWSDVTTACQVRKENRTEKWSKVGYQIQRDLLVRYLFNLIAGSKGNLCFGGN